MQPPKNFKLASGTFRLTVSAPGAAARKEWAVGMGVQGWDSVCMVDAAHSPAGGPGVQTAGFGPERGGAQHISGCIQHPSQRER